MADTKAQPGLHEWITFRGFKGSTTKRVKLDGSRTSDAPKISCSLAYSESVAERHALALEVRHALLTHGYFYLVDHGIQHGVQARLLEAMQTFFRLPRAKKMEIHHALSQAKRGYLYELEGRDDEPDRFDLREAFKALLDPNDGIEHALSSSYNLWLSENDAPGLRAAVCDYAAAMLRTAKQLIRIIALALDAPEDLFEDKTTDLTSLSLFRYPPSPPHQKNPGRMIHTDYTLFTLIDQLTPTQALEVLGNDGCFVQVPPVEGSVVIVVGDMLERISNHVFQSTIHRVINAQPMERFSATCFYDPRPEALIEVLPSCVSEDRPCRYKPVLAGEWQQELLNNIGSRA